MAVLDRERVSCCSEPRGLTGRSALDLGSRIESLARVWRRFGLAGRCGSRCSEAEGPTRLRRQCLLDGKRGIRVRWLVDKARATRTQARARTHTHAHAQEDDLYSTGTRVERPPAMRDLRTAPGPGLAPAGATLDPLNSPGQTRVILSLSGASSPRLVYRDGPSPGGHTGRASVRPASAPMSAPGSTGMVHFN